jgi:hypothetical protein
MTEKCCGLPHTCPRFCTWATTVRETMPAVSVADHVNNLPRPLETEVTSTIDDQIQESTLFRVLGKSRLVPDPDISIPMPPRAAPIDPPKPVNPKDGLGILKLPLHLWPVSATAHGSLALLDGLLKYGRMNWRGTEVRASVYVGALLRHVAEWMEGENVDAKSGLHPLAHALACLAIIVDAQAAGTLVDDRNYPGGYAALAELLTPHVARLQALYAEVKAPHHRTIRDQERLAPNRATGAYIDDTEGRP